MAALLLQRDSQPSAELLPIPTNPLPAAFGAIQSRLSPDGLSRLIIKARSGEFHQEAKS